MLKKRMIVVVLLMFMLAVGTATPAQAHSVGSRAPGVIQGQKCGGDLPPCYVMQRESRSAAYPNGGDPRIWNGGCYNGPCRGGSTASGKWQFIHGTFAHYKGYRDAAVAPAEIQDEKARALWRLGKGCYHWAAC